MASGGLPDILELLLDSMTEKVNAITLDLIENGGVNAWETAMQNLLAQFSAAALMAGLGRSELTDAERALLEKTVSAQLEFLRNFAIEIQSADEFKAGWAARARMYAQSIKNPYWHGATDMLPLPAMPGDGTTQCRVNCKCKWEVVALDRENGDYNCYWRLGAAEHCQSCKRRAASWSPIEIRGGSIV